MFNVKLFAAMAPVETSSGLMAVHQNFIIMLGGRPVGDGINIQLSDGQRYITIHNHDRHLEPALRDYFGSRKGVLSVQFGRAA